MVAVTRSASRINGGGASYRFAAVAPGRHAVSADSPTPQNDALFLFATVVALVVILAYMFNRKVKILGQINEWQRRSADDVPPWRRVTRQLFPMTDADEAVDGFNVGALSAAAAASTTAGVGNSSLAAAATVPIPSVEYRRADVDATAVLHASRYYDEQDEQLVGSAALELWPDDSFGVARAVDTTRTARLGYTRRLRRYQRKDVVYVPDFSHDTAVCDAWMGNGHSVGDDPEQTARAAAASSSAAPLPAPKLVRCALADGDDACFRCVESRRFVRKCVHLDRPVLVASYAGTNIQLPASGDAASGWCLPQRFADIRYDSSSGAVQPPKEIARNCNPLTGNWILSQLGQDGGQFDSSYNWVCKCRYPNLMTNSDTITSDCDRPVGCLPYGELDENSRRGLVDPYARGFCVCRDTHTAQFEPSVGPTCAPRQLTDTPDLQSLFRTAGIPFTKGVLPLTHLSKRFRGLYAQQNRAKLALPDPCQVDIVTGVPDATCHLAYKYRMEGKTMVPIVFCESDANSWGFAVRTDSDYLLNNEGRYANACLQVRPNYAVPPLKERHYRYMLSYFNAKPVPDVGVLIPTAYLTPPFAQFVQQLGRDFEYRAFVRDKVHPIVYDSDYVNRRDNPKDIFGNITYYKNMGASVIIYDDYPSDLCQEANPASACKSIETSLISPRLAWIYRTFSLVHSRRVLVYNGLYRFYSVEVENGITHTTNWLILNRQGYNKFARDSSVPESGVVVVGYITQAKEPLKMWYRADLMDLDRSSFGTYGKFPLMPIKCLLWECEMPGRDGQWAQRNYIPSLYPHLSGENIVLKPFQPNTRYHEFDASLCVSIDEPDPDDYFHFARANMFVYRFPLNFLGYQSRIDKFNYREA